VLAVYGFIQHVRVATSETHDLLFQSHADLRHQVVVALTPQLVAMSQHAWHTATRRFDDMLPHRLGIERR
jgi:hypothetical protein